MLPQQYFLLRRYGRPSAPVKVGDERARLARGGEGGDQEAVDRRAAPHAAVGAPPPQALGEAALSEDSDELTPEEELEDLLETLVEAFDIDAKVAIWEDDGVLRGSVEGPGAEALVGSDGAILEAVQHLAQRIVLRGEGGLRVVVDAAGYRGRREEALRAEADRVADLRAERGARDRAAADAGGRAAVPARVPARARGCRDAQRGR